MDIEQIQNFNKVVTLKSISKAAAACHISQPALSQQMQKLEDSIGMGLLIRSNKGIELTEAGAVVERYAARMIEMYDNMTRDIQNLRRDKITFRICSTPHVSIYALPCTMFEANEKFSNVAFVLSTFTSAEVQSRVASGDQNIGFVIGAPEDKNLSSRKIYSDKIHLVAAYDYNIPERITLAEIVEKKYPFIMFWDDFLPTKIFSDSIQSSGVAPSDLNIVFRLDSYETVKSLISNGHGISFMPYIAIKKELYRKQLKIVNVDEFEMNFDIYLVYRTGDASDKANLEMVEYFAKIAPATFC